jgi:ABC-type uncharacterized transport system substrate-binding protein
MRRREFIALVGGAAVAWPLASRAQRNGAPVIGVLDNSVFLDDFRKGLVEGGLVEGKDVAIEVRTTERYEELRAFAEEFVQRRVTVIAALGGVPANEARRATSTIPIVFTVGGDPVELGLVANLNRPGANLTGATFFAAQLLQKQVGLLRDLLPKATTIAVLVNPNNPRRQADIRDVQGAARLLGLQVVIAEAGSQSEIDNAFAHLAEQKVQAGILAGDAFFFLQREQIVGLAARHAIPMMYNIRGYVTAGGFVSYGSSLPDAYNQAGRYAARIVKGEKPGDLPVIQPSRFGLIINIKSAKALGLDIPLHIHQIADEIIE